MKKRIVLLSILCFTVSCFTAQAALVPCGTSSTNPCDFCDFMVLGQNVIDFLLYLVFPISAIMIVVGGIMIMTAAGSAERAAKGRQIVKAAITGLIIALISWLILDTIFRTLASGHFKDDWYKIGKNIGC